MAAGSTRERLVTEAMKLFSDRVSKPRACPRSKPQRACRPDRGALYRHFKSKDALLSAGIDRQLDRRSAMQDIRALFAGLGDLHSELTVLGRYVLTVIDQESELLQIAARTPAGLSDRLDTAYAALVDGLCEELNGWISVWAPDKSPEQTRVLASLGINSLLGERFSSNLFRRSPVPTTDDEYLKEWTATLAARVRSLG